MSVLYLSYNGLLEQLGQSQVYQYLRRLAEGHPIALVTYEKREDWADAARREALKREVRSLGIRWVPLRYHKSPSAPATAYDLAVGLLVSLYLVLRHRVRVVHARSYIVATLALVLKRLFGVGFIFDMRGFWVDARLELGIWRATSPVYRAARWLERRFLLEADAVVALSQGAVEVMRKLPYLQGRSPRFEVITVCTNLDLFKPASGRPGGSGGPFTLGYVGNAGPGYLFDAVLDCFAQLRSRVPGARLLIVNRKDHAYIRERLRERRFAPDAVELKAVEHREVPDEMRRMDAGVFFISPHPSRVSSVPTRMGEFLACGLPCLGNAGVGSVVEVLEGEGVGAVVREFTPEALGAGVDALLALASRPGMSELCVAAARRHFSLEDGVRAYDRLYRDLGSPAR